jgi:hypothetical protein
MHPIMNTHLPARKRTISIAPMMDWTDKKAASYEKSDKFVVVMQF